MLKSKVFSRPVKWKNNSSEFQSEPGLPTERKEVQNVERKSPTKRSSWKWRSLGSYQTPQESYPWSTALSQTQAAARPRDVRIPPPSRYRNLIPRKNLSTCKAVNCWFSNLLKSLYLYIDGDNSDPDCTKNDRMLEQDDLNRSKGDLLVRVQQRALL